MLMLDTDVIIWILRGRENEIKSFEQYAYSHEGILCITPIQSAEIYSGMRSEEEIETGLLLKKLYTIDLTIETGILAGKYLRQYSKTHNVTLSDAMIADACRLTGMNIWTYNKKHYPMLSDKEII